MMGRKIRRGLPLLCPGKATFDDDQLNERDYESKLRAKEREDSRRGARGCRVKPGDKVVVERLLRAKAEPRFDPHKFTVTEEKNGMLILSDEAGRTMRRHVSQTRKVYDWEKPATYSSSSDIVNESVHSDTSSHPAQEPHSAEEVLSHCEPKVQRPARERRAPTYLDSYIHATEK